jgi:purine-binding chemotaxis protein CheW
MNTATLETPASGLGQTLAGKYLTFRLGQESYGLPVLKVREIIRLTPITPVPRMPHYIKGVINLRGKVIPVVDLRAKFGLSGDGSNVRTCIVVVQVELSSGTKPFMGLIVDAVEEVANLPAQDIEAAPDFGTALDTAYILGMAKTKEAVKTLLDIDKVVAADALELTQAKAAH